MSNLQRVSLDCVSVGSRGGGYYRERLWLCWQRCVGAGCSEVVSLAQGLNSALPKPRARSCHGFEEGPGGGSRLVPIMK